jgi:CTP synthase
MPFVEALRQLQLKVRPENFCIVHVSMVPIVGSDGEQKTKPTQHSVKELRGLGLVPDFIVCRAKVPVQDSSRAKIASFCNVPEDHVLSIHDLPNIYHVPLLMLEQNFHALLTKRLGLDEIAKVRQLNKQSTITYKSASILSRSNGAGDGNGVAMEQVLYPWDERFSADWTNMAIGAEKASDEAVVALVGKYTTQQDSYMSVISSLKHACIATNQKLRLIMLESSNLEPSVQLSNPALYEETWARLKEADGILVPGGFGIRGIEGKVEAIRYARENNVPFLGICLGMQVAVIEFTRSVLKRPLANSREFAPTISEHDAAVIFMPEGDRNQMGGTMRLGSRRTFMKEASIAKKLYHDEAFVDERHRHRYEVNPQLVHELESKGLAFSGKDISNERMEIVELDREKFPGHPYFIGVQFHPEFKSRPLRPSPVFLGLLEAIKTAPKR